MSSLVVNHLDLVWNDLKKRASQAGVPVTQLNDQIRVVGNGSPIVKSAGFPKRAIANGVNISRMPPTAFNPFLSITTLQLPTELKALNALRRFYYVHDPFCRTALDLHTKYPISEFRVRVSEDEDIQEEYQEIAEDLDLMQFLLWMGQEYWVVGEAIPFGHWNKDTACWDSFVLMNPDYIDIVHPILGEGSDAGSRTEIYLSNYSKELIKIIHNGASDPKTGHLFKNLKEKAPDLVDKIIKNQPFRLADMCSSHVSNRQYFAARGFSPIDSILRVLMYEERLYEAQIRGAERYQNPIELWKLGSQEDPADDESYDKFEAVLQNTWTSPVKAIIWNHAIENVMIGAAPAMLPLGPEFEHTEQLKMTGLMVDASLLHGEGPTYANASVASDYRIGFYQTYRSQLERWVKKHFYEPIAIARGYYKPVKKEISGHYRVKRQRKPIVPDIVWSRGLRTDVFGTLNMMIPLAQEGKIPWRRIYELMDFDTDEILTELQKEAKQFSVLMQLQNAASGQPGAAIGGEGLPPALGGGGGEPLGAEDLEEAGAQSLGAGPPSVRPPESSGPTAAGLSNQQVGG